MLQIEREDLNITSYTNAVAKKDGSGACIDVDAHEVNK